MMSENGSIHRSVSRFDFAYAIEYIASKGWDIHILFLKFGVKLGNLPREKKYPERIRRISS
jgi:hypothetical protein